ncbi:MAG: DUF4097 family beta strand repeat protein [candidate division Zixibacteria bacterium]|nr:DUF4097 family beta strand repeat protein [candidate division Zixibacteria bacterium]
MVKLLVKFGLLICLFFLLAVSSSAKSYTFDYQKILDVGDKLELELNFINGKVEIIGSDTNRLIIDAVKKINAVDMDEAAKVADHIELKVRQSGDKVTVNTNYLRMIDRSPSFWEKVLGVGGSDSYGNVDFVITVPQNCRVVISNTSGEVKAGYLRGDISIHSSAADIQLASIEGEVKIDNNAGITRGELLFGPVTIRQPMGEIDLEWVEGDVRIKSSSARINIRQERGALDLTTTTGSVDIQTNLNCVRDNFIQTESGHIHMLVPQASSGTLQIASDMGNIKTEIPVSIKSMSKNKLVGEFGTGGVKVTLTSTTGDVTVAQF